MNQIRTPVRLSLARLHAVVLSVLVSCTAAFALPMAWVTVPGPANPPDVFGHGAVAYDYMIGIYEVSNAQYTAFLNAVARADTYGLFNPSMAITRTGSAGAYAYSTSSPDLPVAFVSWYDGLRFANWLHHGQPTGAPTAATTEDGAYALTGATTAGPRRVDARAWLPSEDEWYKAAYYVDDGTTAGYWEYPTGSMAAPIAAPPTSASGRANFNAVVGGAAPVGSYPGSLGPHGTLDQAGNVWEWTETATGAERIIRGGSWKDYDLLLQAAYRDSDLPTFESAFIGLRMAAPGSAPGGGNAAPVAVADSHSVNQDTTLAVSAPGVLGNDTDADGNALTAVPVSGVAHGTLTRHANGSFTYAPAPGYVGSDSFTYRASDGALSSAAATVTITVMPVSTGKPLLSLESASARRVGDAYEVTMTLRNRGRGAANDLTLVRARLDRFETRNVDLGGIPAGSRLTSTVLLRASDSRRLSGTVKLRLDFNYVGGSVSLSRDVRISSRSDDDDDD